MTWGCWLLGLLVLACGVVPPFLGAASLRRRFLPGWPLLPAAMAVAVGAITAIVLLAEVLGTLGWLRSAPLAIGGVVLGAALHRIGAGRSPYATAAGADRRHAAGA